MKTSNKKKMLIGSCNQKQSLCGSPQIEDTNGTKRLQWRKLIFFSAILMLFFSFGLTSCKDKQQSDTIEIKAADSKKPTNLISFSPDSGGIATPMIIEGDNFGTDTTKLKVLFISELVDDSGNKTGVFDTVPGSIITSNGNRIYLVVPKLTNKKDLQVAVKTMADNGEVRMKVFDDKKRFNYRTETTVTTVAGQAFPDMASAVTQGGTLSTATFSCPMFMCVDDEKNLLIVERDFSKSQPEMDINHLEPKTANKEHMEGDFLLLNEKEDRVDFMQKTKDKVNAPTIDPTGKVIYIPTDGGADYYILKSDENYSPRLKRIKPDGDNKRITENNWKFSFVTYNNPNNANDPNNGMIYTIMYNKQLVKINPTTNLITVVSEDIGVKTGSDSYLIFSSISHNTMFASITNRHSIYKLVLEKKRNEKGEIDPNGKDTVRVTPYAGQAINNKTGNGPENRGWADGRLYDAKFNFPRQLVFDEDGVLYIADCVNHCIRTIDTRLPESTATVRTIVGIPGDKGNADGGPELAKLNYPMGLAVAKDGTIYIADTRNYSIRKLAIQ